MIGQYKALDGVKVGTEPNDTKNQKCAVFTPQKKKSKYIFQFLNGLTKMLQSSLRKGISSAIHSIIGGGQFDVTQRLGCVGCPLQSRKKRIQEFKDNPKMLKAWIRAGQKYFLSDKYQKGKSYFKFKDAFESMGYQLYCDNIEQFKEKTYGMFGDFDWKEYLQKEFNIDMSDI